jgi:hypothetical protein
MAELDREPPARDLRHNAGETGYSTRTGRPAIVTVPTAIPSVADGDGVLVEELARNMSLAAVDGNSRVA